jgi:hypothetical protein
MTPASRPSHTVSNHVMISRHTASHSTHLCKFTKWHHERRQNLWKTKNIVRKPTKPMLKKSGGSPSAHAANSNTQIVQTANPHKPS